jgi:TM2 domain-containing membrane protein YozV
MDLTGAPVSAAARRLRFGGLALVVLSCAALATLGETLRLEETVGVGTNARTWWAVVAIAAAVNGLAFGLVLLLVGLRSLSLRDPRVRQGVGMRMLAVNLMLPCAIVAAIVDLEWFAALGVAEWVQGAAIVGFLVTARHSVALFRSGWKYEAVPAAAALARDPRPPVVYLRSFGADDEILVTGGGLWARLGSYMHYTAVISPEQELAWILSRVGPVVAIGKPGERLPELGAARLYVGDDEWRETVGGLLARAALVVIRAGDTANLWWEIDQAMTQCAPGRVVIVALGPESRFEAFNQRFARAFGEAEVPVARGYPRVVRMALALLFPYGRNTGRIIYFDERRRPHACPLTWTFSAAMLITSVYSPHGAALRQAFRHVLAELGLPWRTTPTQTVAVLLALFCGAIGLHHFYLGDRRTGWWRCAFAWSGVPAVLGIADALRLCALDEQRFQARFEAPAWSQRAHSS